MYKSWWRCSSQLNGHQTPVENGDGAHQKEPGDSEGVLSSDGSLDEDSWNVLLSEPHADLQATQRALEAIQSRVAALIQQHGHVQVESGDLTEEQSTSDGLGDPETR